MLRYSIDREKKEIELLSGGDVSELKEIFKLFKGYTFKLGVDNTLKKSGIIVGAAYVPIIGNKDYN